MILLFHVIQFATADGQYPKIDTQLLNVQDVSNYVEEIAEKTNSYVNLMKDGIDCYEVYCNNYPWLGCMTDSHDYNEKDKYEDDVAVQLAVCLYDDYQKDGFHESMYILNEQMQVNLNSLRDLVHHIKPDQEYVTIISHGKTGNELFDKAVTEKIQNWIDFINRSKSSMETESSHDLWKAKTSGNDFTKSVIHNYKTSGERRTENYTPIPSGVKVDELKFKPAIAVANGVIVRLSLKVSYIGNLVQDLRTVLLDHNNQNLQSDTFPHLGMNSILVKHMLKNNHVLEGDLFNGKIGISRTYTADGYLGLHFSYGEEMPQFQALTNGKLMK